MKHYKFAAPEPIGYAEKFVPLTVAIHLQGGGTAQMHGRMLDADGNIVGEKAIPLDDTQLGDLLTGFDGSEPLLEYLVGELETMGLLAGGGTIEDPEKKPK